MNAQLRYPLFAVLSLVAAAFTPGVQQAAKEPINFNRDVKPILSRSCFQCHGPDAAVVAANLRLDSFEAATKNRNGRQGIVPGNLRKSWVWIRISHEVEEVRMPPPTSDVKPLSPQEVDIIRRWIEGGAKYEEHWAFVPPKRPLIPHVSDYRWAKTPIDRFVLANLEKAGLKPEPEADRRTLIRRVALSLTGLPPTPSEIQAFESDQGMGAYERMVDRYLASQRYGEHQARYWLDAVRYGDTHGLHLDNERAIYPYRDWVVRALNQDLPFDQFTIWQMAGDLLPNPTTEQRIATGYIRMNPTTNEGGAIEAEFLAKNTFDRVDTTSTIFLGMTVACARCHDHKYDPISQKDYYRLYAFFNSTKDAPLDGNDRVPAPVIRAATKEQEAQLKDYDQVLQRLLSSVDVGEAEKWLMAEWRPPVKAAAWELSEVFSGGSFDEVFAKDFGPEKGASGAWKPLKLELGKVAANIVGKENAAVYVRGTIDSPRAQDLKIRLQSDDGVRVWIDGKLVHDNKVLRGITAPGDEFVAPLKAGQSAVLIKIVNAGGGDGLLLRFGDDFTERLDQLHSAWTSGNAESRKPSELARLYLEIGPITAGSKEYRKVKREREQFEEQIPFTLVAEEMDKPRVAHVLKRGEYHLPAEPVERGIPTALGMLPSGVPLNRLGLAQWLVSKDNPLVARVFVNRLWQQHFGTGLVRTAEDFGNQGEWPVNPELLDYLAVSFRDGGWSIKRLHREVVLSNAFRQRSTASKEKLEKDPENRLVSRGPRFRLDAEVIRDQALMASGLLVEKLGGMGFKPYQPDGIWEAIAFTESNTARYVRDKGDDIYRRSLYLYWKRTSPHPVMMAFDAPMREACTVQRSRTNTPLQALVTLNEPAFLEAARQMAQRVWLSAPSFEQRLALAYELALGRPPRPAESERMHASLQRYLQRYSGAPEDAQKLLSVGDAPRDGRVPLAEHAAWMMLCSTLMNTDEFLTQH